MSIFVPQKKLLSILYGHQPGFDFVQKKTAPRSKPRCCFKTYFSYFAANVKSALASPPATLTSEVISPT
jgi:hypothetical protein